MTLSLISVDQSKSESDMDSIKSESSIDTYTITENTNEDDTIVSLNPFQKTYHWFHDRPMVRLFSVLTFNGIFSLAMAAVILGIGMSKDKKGKSS